MFFGLLEPFSFLYERAFSMDEAIYEHTELEHALDSMGVRVHRLKRFAIRLSRDNPDVVQRARDYVEQIVKFEGSHRETVRARREFRNNIAELDTETIFNILTLRPSIRLVKKKGVRVIFPHVTLDVPLANLFFMRDQQAVSDLGVIVGRMSKPQRQMEPGLTSAVLEMGGAKIVHHVKPPGTFEGGDFIPAGEFAMIGMGDRTNSSGVSQILRHGVGFEEMAVVHQPAHPLIPGDEPDPMINMHLDTYLNVPGNRVAVGCTPLLKKARVEVYHKSAEGQYKRNMETPNLWDYLTGHGFTIVPITTLEQMCYASNFLCVKDHKILAIETEKVVDKVMANLDSEAKADPYRYRALLQEAKKEYAELKDSGQFFPHKKEFNELSVDATSLNLQEITGGYGGAHCMTCVLSRK
jgi:arginine deiminase